MKTRSQTSKSKQSRNVSKKRVRSQRTSLKYGDGSLKIDGWTVCRRKWNRTQINSSYKAIKRKIDKLEMNSDLTKGCELCTNFKINNISKTLDKNIKEHMVEIVHDLSTTKNYNEKDMVCIIDSPGSTEGNIPNNTNIKECYIVYHAITTWRLYIRLKTESILLKLKAGDILIMNGDIYHSKRSNDTLRKSFILCVPIGFSL